MTVEAPIRALDVSKVFPGASVPVLDGCSLTVAPAARLAITGPSGSGKSTLLFLLGLLDTPSSGSVEVFGRDAAGLSEAERTAIRRDRLGFVFQDHHLLPQATALENALVPWLTDGRPDAAAVARARDLLDRLGLGDRMDHLPAQLSTGQRQRVALARALARSPEVVLADEPTGALDRASADELMALLDAVCGDAALVVVTHDPVVAGALGDHRVLRDGRLVEAP